MRAKTRNNSQRHPEISTYEVGHPSLLPNLSLLQLTSSEKQSGNPVLVYWRDKNLALIFIRLAIATASRYVSLCQQRVEMKPNIV